MFLLTEPQPNRQASALVGPTLQLFLKNLIFEQNNKNQIFLIKSHLTKKLRKICISIVMGNAHTQPLTDLLKSLYLRYLAAEGSVGSIKERDNCS